MHEVALEPEGQKKGGLARREWYVAQDVDDDDEEGDVVINVEPVDHFLPQNSVELYSDDDDEEEEEVGMSLSRQNSSSSVLDAGEEEASARRWPCPAVIVEKVMKPGKRVRFTLHKRGQLFFRKEALEGKNNKQRPPRRLSSTERLVLHETRPDLDVRDTEWSRRVRALRQPQQPPFLRRGFAWLTEAVKGAADATRDFGEELQDAIRELVIESDDEEEDVITTKNTQDKENHRTNHAHCPNLFSLSRGMADISG